MRAVALARAACRARLHECAGAWLGTGIKNGELLRLAGGEFDLFITCDQGIRCQQNLVDLGVAILQLSTNDLRRIRAAAVALRSAVAAVREYEFQELVIP